MEPGVLSSTASNNPQSSEPERQRAGGFTCSAYSHIGDRKTQEDRYVLCSELPHGRAKGKSSVSAFFGVFDGTVGDFASENVKELIVPKLLEQQAWADLAADPTPALLARAMQDAYLAVDNELLRRCSINGEHYATCTSVTVAIVGDMIAVAHLGDSRVIVGHELSDGLQKEKGEMHGESVTVDHEPHLPVERDRIEGNGGTVERLQKHGNKPYIRGGDFMMRKTLGEQPMQLQYSRAFGGKDLKCFGLTAKPEVRIIRRGPGTKHIILASDGIWGTVSPKEAVQLAKHAPERGINPAEAIVKFALHHQAQKKRRSDNVTAVVIELD